MLLALLRITSLPLVIPPRKVLRYHPISSHLITILSSYLFTNAHPISPPLPIAAQVSFDTFENPATSMFSYTLHVQSSAYTRNRATRVFLCAASPDESGSQALDWALSELVRDGDELTVLRGIEKEELDFIYAIYLFLCETWSFLRLRLFCRALIEGFRGRFSD